MSRCYHMAFCCFVLYCTHSNTTPYNCTWEAGWAECSRNTAILLLRALILKQSWDFPSDYEWFSWLTANICVFRTVTFIDNHLCSIFKTVLEISSLYILANITWMIQYLLFGTLEWNYAGFHLLCGYFRKDSLSSLKNHHRENVRWVGTQDCLLKNCWAHLYSIMISFQN